MHAHIYRKMFHHGKSDRGKPIHRDLQFPPSVVPHNQMFPQHGSLPKQKRAHGKGLLSLREKLKNLKP